MDFDLTSEHEAVIELSAQILSEHSDPARLRILEDGEWIDREALGALAEAGLLASVLSPDHGGAGLGMFGVHLLLEQAGLVAANVPLWESLVGLLTLEAHGGPAAVIEAVGGGSELIALALQEPIGHAEDPRTVAEPDGDVWRVTGQKVLVSMASESRWMIVSARVGDEESGIFLIEASDAQVVGEALSSRVPHGRVTLKSVPARRIGAEAALTWMLLRARAGLSSLQCGLSQGSVRLAAEYTSQREQFGRPIATFQAVSQRVAQAFIEAECARLTALQAAWRLDTELPASDEVAVAKWWAATAGHQVLHAAQHVHGGVGVDREYPLHRFLLRTKQIEFTLGSAADHLGALGEQIAADTQDAHIATA